MTVPDRLTVPKLTERKRDGRRITMVTAYDYPTALLLEEAQIDVLLVGDSLAMVVLGRDNTLSVTVDEIVHHTKAVARARQRALLVADMPFMSYHISRRQAVGNAGRLIQEAGADAVKVEGGRKRASVVKAIVDAEIPVMGHVGLNPQAIQRLGGFKIQGRTLDRAEEILRDAEALERAGVFALVLEAIPEELGRLITRSVGVPTIGIGAGRYCDGQVLVFHDLVGLEQRQKPRFVRRYARLRDPMLEALSAFKREVDQGRFPSDAEVYPLSPEVAHTLRERHGSES